MTWLLKIIQGPNAGAEIELPDGVVTRIGRSMDCDVMLQDNQMAENALALDPQREAIVLTPLATGCRVGTTLLEQGRPESVPPYTPFLVGGTVCCCGDADTTWPDVDTASLFAKIGAEAEETHDDTEDPATAPLEAPEEVDNGPSEEELEAQRLQEEKQERRRLLIRKAFRIFFRIFLLLLVLALALLAAWRVWNITRPEDDHLSEYQEQNEMILASLVKKYDLTLEDVDDNNTPRKRASGNFARTSDRQYVVAALLRVYPNCILDFSDDETLKSAVGSALVGLTENSVEVVSAKDRTAHVQGMMDNFSDWTNARSALQKEVRHLEHLQENVVLADEMCKRFKKALSAAGLHNLTVRAGKRQFVFAGAVAESQKGTLLAILDECSKYVPENVSVIHAVRWTDDTTGISYGNALPDTPSSPTVEAPAKPQLPLPVSGIMLSPVKCLVLQDGSRCLEGGTTRNCTVLKITEDSAVILFNGEEYTWRP